MSVSTMPSGKRRWAEVTAQPVDVGRAADKHGANARRFARAWEKTARDSE